MLLKIRKVILIYYLQMLALYNLPHWEKSQEHFDKLFNINVKGLLFTVQKALPIFRDGGSIILTASIGASNGSEEFSIYHATKAAIRSFARCWTRSKTQKDTRQYSQPWLN